MTDVITLLDLPVTSKGFTALRPGVIETVVDGSASPPHKAARLEGDSDSGSASRSRARAQERSEGPIKLQISGDPGMYHLLLLLLVVY